MSFKELRTEAIDKILEAIAPALGAELNRAIEEARQEMESEIQKRVQSAVDDAESGASQTIEARVKQGVSEATRALRQEVTEELWTELSAESKRSAAEWAAERERLENQIVEWRLLADAPKELALAASQPEMLARFLTLAERFAPSIGVYTAKAEGLALWKARGAGAFPPVVSQESTDPAFYFRRIVVRDKVVAGIGAWRPDRSDALDLLAAALEQAVALFGLKLRTPRPQPPASDTPPAAPVQSSEEKACADARQTAHLLVTELKLSYELEVRDGRANGDLYRRLHQAIESGREQYRQLAAAALPSPEDYFHEELVRVLADGDVSRLGPDYPGPLDRARSARS